MSKKTEETYKSLVNKLKLENHELRLEIEKQDKQIGKLTERVKFLASKNRKTKKRVKRIKDKVESSYEEHYNKHIKQDVVEEIEEIIEDERELCPEKFDIVDDKVMIKKPDKPLTSGKKWFNFKTQQYEDIPNTLPAEDAGFKPTNKMSYSRMKERGVG